MSVTPIGGRPGSDAVISHPGELSELLGIPFSEQQLAAITAPLAPAVIIAGAGSGKTTVMAARVVWLVGTGQVRPEEVLGLTFTRKAAAELSERVRAALDAAGVVNTEAVDEAGEQLIMTYDAFAARLVADHGPRVGVESGLRMVTGAMRHRLASRVVANAAGPFEQLSRLQPMTVTDRVLELDSQMQQHLVDSTMLGQHARLFAQQLANAPVNSRGQVPKAVRDARGRLDERLELASLADEYAAVKRERGVVEFADQMAVAADLVTRVPEVAVSLRESYQVVLLDEYQDTSSAQAMVLAGLFSGPSPSQGRGHPVTAVGDPFQAIYGWRGAAASNITQFADEFRTVDGRPAQTYALTVNRRSGQTILDVANEVAAPLRELVGAGDETLLVAPESNGNGEVHAATFDTWPEEVSWICDRIVESGPDREDQGTRRPGLTPRQRRPGLTARPRRWSDLAVLTRRNADIAEIWSQLTARDIPAEIVGLGGLLHLPEIADVVATLRVVDDVTANPDLVRLLTGPRWAVGPDDLALLGRRARDLVAAGQGPEVDDDAPRGLSQDMAGAVADVDVSELVSLVDAIDDPGAAPYSPQARRAFSALSAELAQLRHHGDEPVLDLVRRVISTIGLDVELIATPELWQTRRDAQLAAFLDAIAGYVDVDPDASLGGLLGWLDAELASGVGLERAVPTDDDSVKLLTIHKAKGLEWDVVFLPALVDKTFPSDRITENWVKNAAVLPYPLRGDAASIPQLDLPVTTTALDRFGDALRSEHRHSEDRLAYVALTRARDQLYGTGHRWRPEGSRSREWSAYLLLVMAEARRQGHVWEEADDTLAEANPLISQAPQVAWPQPLDPDALERRRQVADWVAQSRAGQRPDQNDLLLDELAVVEQWDLDAERLLAEARQARRHQVEVPLPPVMSASDWLRATADPDAHARDLLRPMPRRPSAAARFGTRFHRWVEQHFGTSSLIDPADLDPAADDDWEGVDLAELCDAFARGQFGERTPYRLEAPLEYRLAGRVIRGRVDAIYREGEADGAQQWLIVDWKTSAHSKADPLQLAIYRLAWAELCQVDPQTVRAGFYYVRHDRLDIIEDLPAADALAERLYGADLTPETGGLGGSAIG